MCFRAYADSEDPDQPALSVIKLMDTLGCMNGEQRPGWYFAHAKNDVNPCIMRIFESKYRDAAQLINEF